ncbi:MAG: hypothetical protein M1113_01185 [Candidatus Thermoplasmatota archaeon]|nr:hypothetical protein [Candidatus Thermoplasmatota archaeon]
MGINYLPLDVEDEQGADISSTPYLGSALYRAEVAKKLIVKLLKKNLNITAERGVILLSLQDGPLVAHEILQGIREIKILDELVSVYVTIASNPQEALIGIKKVEQMTDRNGKTIKGSEAFSAAYEGKMGEYFINSSELLRDINNRQVSLNVYFPKSRIQSINSTLFSFDESLDINLGYAKDTSMGNPSDKDFYAFLKKVPTFENSLTNGLIRNFLYDKNGEYSSPLRSIEVIRAIILGLIMDSHNGLSYVDLFKQLDTSYDRVSKFDPSLALIKERNNVTKALVNQMRAHNILNLKQGTCPIIIKGESWDESSILQKPWLDLYREVIL